MSLQNINLNTVPKAQKQRSVEGKLWVTLEQLAGAESNIHLFSTLKKLGLSTNDVKHFNALLVMLSSDWLMPSR